MKRLIMTAGLIGGLGVSSVSAEMPLKDLKGAADLGDAATASTDAGTAKAQGEESIQVLAGGLAARGAAASDPVFEGGAGPRKTVLQSAAAPLLEPRSASPAVAGPLAGGQQAKRSDGSFREGFMNGFSAVEGLAGDILDLGIDGHGNYPMPNAYFLPAAVGAGVAAVALAPVAAVVGLGAGVRSLLKGEFAGNPFA